MRAFDFRRAELEAAFEPHDVRRLQEWLWLHGLRVEIDGLLGPATREALAEFCRRHELDAAEPDDSIVAALTLPMQRALSVRIAPGTPLPEAAIRIARVHLAAGAAEAPGDNRGPWVRLYGEEGLPWCAGFVSFVMRQAADSAGRSVPIPGSLGCDELASQATRRRRFVEGGTPCPALPGDVFLSWRPVSPGGKDFVHAGFVEEVRANALVTIEGNTNPAGGREGYEVERRIRSFDRKDFIRLG